MQVKTEFNLYDKVSVIYDNKVYNNVPINGIRWETWKDDETLLYNITVVEGQNLLYPEDRIGRDFESLKAKYLEAWESNQVNNGFKFD